MTRLAQRLLMAARGLALASALSAASEAAGAVHVVDSLPALQERLDAAESGDIITVRNGRYVAGTGIRLGCAGTGERPITVAAEAIGGVEIAGSHGFEIAPTTAHVAIMGFDFTHASGVIHVPPGSHHVRFLRNTFRCAGDGAYLEVGGDDVEIAHNEFRDKGTKGNMISVTGLDGQVARRVWIHHNHFHDFAKAGVNGAETIRLGLSGLSMSTGGSLVEHNLFVRCVGENELISNKSCGNTYRYNTFLDSPGGQLTLRHGNDCLAYGNTFRGTDGLRIFGDRHRVFSNHFEGNTLGITIGNGGGEVADGDKLTSHDRPDQCMIAFNTFVDNRVHYRMTPRQNGLGATATIFAYNLIQGGGVAAALDGPYPGAVWRGNLLWQTGGPGTMPADGFAALDPRMLAGDGGIFRPQTDSPALDAAADAYPGITYDIDGQPRPVAGMDAGADEVSTAPVISRILTPGDVGPHSGR